MSRPNDADAERRRATFRQMVYPPSDDEPDPSRCHPWVRPELARHVKVWTPRNRDVVRLVSTEREMTGLLLHRLDGRSELCTQGVRYCYGCRLKLPRRWMGYLGAFLWATRTPCVLSITPFALRHLYQTWPVEKSLYRVKLAAARASDSPRGKMWLAASGIAASEVIPYEAQALPVLARVFHVPAAEVHLLEQVATKFLLDNPMEAGGE